MANCSAHGACVVDGDVASCVCDRRYAGVICTYRRKSQRTAFLLSLFLGLL
jgi:hypothetical protein